MLTNSEIEKAYNLAMARALNYFQNNPEKESCGFAVLIAAYNTTNPIISNKGETKGKEVLKVRSAVIWRIIVERKADGLKCFNRIQGDPFLTPEEGWILREKLTSWKNQNNEVRQELNKELAQALRQRNREYFLELHEQICEWLAKKEGK